MTIGLECHAQVLLRISCVHSNLIPQLTVNPWTPLHPVELAWHIEGAFYTLLELSYAALYKVQWYCYCEYKSFACHAQDVLCFSGFVCGTIQRTQFNKKIDYNQKKRPIFE